jgi:hypothetical protein
MKKIGLLILILGLMPLSVFAKDKDKPMARVVTFKENVTNCLASVEIKQIDGHLRNLPSLGFEIEPGWHTMHGSAKLNLRQCPVNDERSREDVHIPALEWLFEAGKVYYVGLDYSSPFRKNWRLIVWDVKDEDS